MPSHQTSPSGVSATLVKIVFFDKRRHRVRIGLNGSARRDAEESGFRIDGAQPALRVRLDPGNVIADSPYLPALEALRWNQHGEICFSASARESGSDIGLLALRDLDADDQHVLRHPALVARHSRRNAQSEAFLAEQRVAAVSGTIRPDLACFWKVDDIFFVVAWPGHIFLSRLERRAHTVQAGNDALRIFVDLFENTGMPMRAMIRMLTTTYGESVSCTPICDIGEPIGPMLKATHTSCGHSWTVEQSAQLLAHLEGIFPVVGGAGGYLLKVSR